MTHQPDGGPAMNDMPAKVWAKNNHPPFFYESEAPYSTAYIRADIVENLVEALRDQFCPRPCNGRPDQFDVGDCVDAMECGCGAGAALALYRKEISHAE